MAEDQNRDLDKIEIRSDEVQEIMGKTPHWLLRWGNTIIFISIATLLGLSWFVKYPDVVPARITITTVNPPIPVVARTTGQIEVLFIAEGDIVQKDQIVGVIQNPADYNEVLALEVLMDSVEVQWKDTTNPPALPTFYSLGTIQGDYSNFVQNYELYRFQTGEDLAEVRVAQLQSQISYYKDLNTTYASQKKTLQAELQLASDKYFSDLSLLEKGVIAQRDVDDSEANYYDKKYKVDNIDVAVINNQLEIQDLQSQINEIRLGDFEAVSNKSVLVQESLNQLQSSIENWKQQHLLVAPIEGQVSFFSFWSENQFVETGSEVMTVVPQGGNLIGKLMLPQAGSGKVKPGQDVNIKLDGYPFEEFGLVHGVVDHTSLIPRDNAYLIEINLPEGLNTSSEIELEFYQEMQGNAEIITEDKRLLERIFYNLKKVFRR